MASPRGRASLTRVVACLSMRPALMFLCGFERGMVGCLATKLGIIIGDLGYLLEVCVDLGVTGRELGSEDAVCCRDIRKRRRNHWP